MNIRSTLLVFTILSCSEPEHKSKDNVASGSDTFYTKPESFDIDKGRLTGKTVHLVIDYAAIACTCAQWFETKNAGDTSGDREYFYLEPGKLGIIDADTLFDGSNLPVRLRLNGQFYSKVGYPKGYRPSKGNPAPAKVFRYDMIEIIQNGE